MSSSRSDDSAVQAAMRAYLAACDALNEATSEVDVLNRSELMSMAAMNLRKRIAETGWALSTAQRTST